MRSPTIGIMSSGDALVRSSAARCSTTRRYAARKSSTLASGAATHAPPPTQRAPTASYKTSRGSPGFSFIAAAREGCAIT